MGGVWGADTMAAQLDADPVDTRVVKALGHPTRVRILNVLRDRELVSPIELSQELGVPLGTVGYHVRRLESLGFIELAKRTQRRGAVEHHYRARQLLAEPARARAKAEAAPAEAGRSSRGRGAQATAYAREAQATLGEGGFDAGLAQVDRRVVRLDAQGRGELEGALAGWRATLERIADGSARRLARGRREPAHRCVAVLMGFELPAGVGEGDGED